MCVFLSVHVVFGHVISGQEVIQTIENQKTDANSRPYAEVKVLNCGELIPKSKGLFVANIYQRQMHFRIDELEFLFSAKKAKKERVRESPSSSSSSDSESSSDSSSESEESEKESKKKKKKRAKKMKKKKEEKKRCLYFINSDSCSLDPLLLFKRLYICRSVAESPEMKEQEEVVTSTVRPEEIPPIPENRFLMRRSPQFQQSKEAEKDQQTKEERQRERLVLTTRINVQRVSGNNDFVCHFCSSRAMYSSQSGYQRRLIITRSGRKIKGRGQRVRPPRFLQESSLPL